MLIFIRHYLLLMKAADYFLSWRFAEVKMIAPHVRYARRCYACDASFINAALMLLDERYAAAAQRLIRDKAAAGMAARHEGARCEA